MWLGKAALFQCDSLCVFHITIYSKTTSSCTFSRAGHFLRMRLPVHSHMQNGFLTQKTNDIRHKIVLNCPMKLGNDIIVKKITLAVELCGYTVCLQEWNENKGASL